MSLRATRHNHLPYLLTSLLHLWNHLPKQINDFMKSNLTILNPNLKNKCTPRISRLSDYSYSCRLNHWWPETQRGTGYSRGLNTGGHVLLSKQACLCTALGTWAVVRVYSALLTAQCKQSVWDYSCLFGNWARHSTLVGSFATPSWFPSLNRMFAHLHISKAGFHLAL